MTPQEELEHLFEAMERHGDAEGTEAQLGDAEGLLRLAYELLSPEQQQVFLRSDAAVSLFDNLEPDDE
jgi:hypothetical protein